MVSKVTAEQQQTDHYKQLPTTYLILLGNKNNRKSERKIRERRGHNS